MTPIARQTLLAALTCALVGCGQSNDDIEVVQPPLRVTFTFPTDGSASPYTSPFSVSVDFNRAATRGELESALFPPTTTGPFQAKSSSGQSWTWLDIDPDPADGCYFWLIDGVDLGFYYENLNNDYVFIHEPTVVRLPASADRHATVGFSGKVSSPAGSVVASGTVVFFLPLTSQFNLLDPGTFDPTEALGVAVAQRFDSFEEPARYTATMLELDEGFIVVAVSDTSRDLVYSPVDDWWGCYVVSNEVAVVHAVVNDPNLKPNPYNSAVDIPLRAPVGTGD